VHSQPVPLRFTFLTDVVVHRGVQVGSISMRSSCEVGGHWVKLQAAPLDFSHSSSFSTPLSSMSSSMCGSKGQERPRAWQAVAVGEGRRFATNFGSNPHPACAFLRRSRRIRRMVATLRRKGDSPPQYGKYCIDAQILGFSGCRLQLSGCA
jgi:hypothetical protein